VQAPLFELHQWDEIIKTEEWRAFVRLLKSHKEYLQGEVNKYLAKHEDRKAGEELAKLNDCDKLLQLVKTRIETLTKQKGDE